MLVEMAGVGKMHEIAWECTRGAMLVGDGVQGGQPGSGRCVSLKVCLIDQEGMQEGTGWEGCV